MRHQGARQPPNQLVHYCAAHEWPVFIESPEPRRIPWPFRNLCTILRSGVCTWLRWLVDWLAIDGEFVASSLASLDNWEITSQATDPFSHRTYYCSQRCREVNLTNKYNHFEGYSISSRVKLVDQRNQCMIGDWVLWYSFLHLGVAWLTFTLS